jgi:hypothetical protein
MEPTPMRRLIMFLEDFLPYILGTMVLAIAQKHPITLDENTFNDFVGSSISISAVMLGFMATSMSILLSYKETATGAKLRNHTNWRRLISFLQQAIIWILIWMILSFCLYSNRVPVLLEFWALFAALSLGCFLRVLYCLTLLM